MYTGYMCEKRRHRRNKVRCVRKYFSLAFIPPDSRCPRERKELGIKYNAGSPIAHNHLKKKIAGVYQTDGFKKCISME